MQSEDPARHFAKGVAVLPHSVSPHGVSSTLHSPNTAISQERSISASQTSRVRYSTRWPHSFRYLSQMTKKQHPTPASRPNKDRSKPALSSISAQNGRSEICAYFTAPFSSSSSHHRTQSRSRRPCRYEKRLQVSEFTTYVDDGWHLTQICTISYKYTYLRHSRSKQEVPVSSIPSLPDNLEDILQILNPTYVQCRSTDGRLPT